jgi:hypothetical protein
VGEALDILVHGDYLLQVLVLAVAEDGVVDHDAIDGGIVVGVDEGVFKLLAVDFSELVGKAARLISLVIIAGVNSMRFNPTQ